MNRAFFLASTLLAACATKSAAPAPPPKTDATDRIVTAATAFLATLDDTGRAKASLAFDDEQKRRWSNFPVGMVPRSGVRWGDLDSRQREAEMKLLESALSADGLREVRQIMAGDEILKKEETGKPPPWARGPGHGGPPGGGPPGGHFDGPKFGSDEYYLAFFGAPSRTAPWMIALGGHHLAINVTVVGSCSVLTPSLPAAQPATYKLDGQTIRPLGRETDRSFALIEALDEGQRKKAVLAYQVSDLVLGPGQDGKSVQPEGIRASELDAAQRALLLALAHEWIGILHDEAAAAKMAEVAAHLDDTWFAWSGPTTRGQPAYFRIQGPTVLIEYAPQGHGELDPLHIHTVYRDPTNDYGAGLVPR